jgi:hypothetical protein
MSRYIIDYWDENIIHTPFTEESIWGCTIKDTQTGIIGSTDRGRSSKTKAYDDAWEDLMQKQKDHYENQKNEYEEPATQQHYETTGRGNENGLIALLIKGAVYILIILGVLWLIFSVAIPLVIINISLIGLIIGWVNKKLAKFVFPISLIGTIFLIVDYNKGWFTKALANNVPFLSGLIPFLFYLNIIAGLVSAYFLIRNLVNNKIPKVENETEFSKRNLIIIGCLLIVGIVTISLQNYLKSNAPQVNTVVNNQSNILSNPASPEQVNPINTIATEDQANQPNDIEVDKKKTIPAQDKRQLSKENTVEPKLTEGSTNSKILLSEKIFSEYLQKVVSGEFFVKDFDRYLCNEGATPVVINGKTEKQMTFTQTCEVLIGKRVKDLTGIGRRLAMIKNVRFNLDAKNCITFLEINYE